MVKLIRKKNKDESNEPVEFIRILEFGIYGLFVGAVIVWLVSKFIVFTAYVEGNSMEDTYMEGETIHIWVYKEAQRGDVIALQNPVNSNESLIKRCIAIPGDTVSLKDGRVYINGVLQDEPYVRDGDFGSSGILSKEITLGDDEYIVLGDNRVDSYDSRIFGVVKENLIYGVVK